MPTNRRKIVRTGKKQSLTLAQIMHLCLGWCLNEEVIWHTDLNFPFKNEKHRRDSWFAHRAEVLKIAESGGPWSVLKKPITPRALNQYEPDLTKKQKNANENQSKSKHFGEKRRF